MSADPRKAFLGTWRLVHSVEYGPGGERHYPFGEDAIGYIIYTEPGVMAVQITRRERPTAGQNPVVGKKDYLAYFRHYEVDVQNAVIRHLLEGELFRAMPRTWNESITFSTRSFRSNRWMGQTEKSYGSECKAVWTMRALQFKAFGDPAAQLALVDLPDPQPRSGWAVVRVDAASVNPSDVKNVAGQMEGTVLPRVPGRDFSGVVEAGPSDWVGTEVWGTGGDAGFTLDGSHAGLIAVPESALARRPAALDQAQAASVGVAFVVGWMGLADYGGLQKGEDVAIVGVSGGVGGAVAQLARALGARRVLGIDRRPPASGSPAATRIDGYLPVDGDVAAAVKARTAGRGADVVFDAVGGVMFETALSCLARKGRLIEIAATGRRRVEFDLLGFVHNESRVFGADSRKLGLVESAAILNKLAPLFDQGSLEAPLVHSVLPLDRGIEAYEAVAAGAEARIVIEP